MPAIAKMPDTDANLAKLAKQMLQAASRMGEDGTVAAALTEIGINDKAVRTAVWRRAQELVNQGWIPKTTKAKPTPGPMTDYVEIGGPIGAEPAYSALCDVLGSLGQAWDAVVGRDIDGTRAASTALFSAAAERRPLTVLTTAAGAKTLTAWLSRYGFAMVGWVGDERPDKLPVVMPLIRQR